ncbi:hypothetical protein BT96DRAFT_828553 [Gymnopus androsaceus JB14]|uniref:Mitochondrial K+-H+ exchange-related-domain-containing protein n=1 Tax=Gymnopus androsaceus JB14 TaxID=1447944 RepID=A0A6A4H857_9AGAR|nr:hypothetical protein BT96DRAFT_828553 [Gymnopus androsaceus JB14]
MVSPKNLQSVQRIISFPITRPRNPSTFLSNSDRKTASKLLTYYQFQVHLPKSTNSKVEETSQSRWQPQGGYIHWAQKKASSTWAGFGKAPEGNWKLKVFQAGERLVDRFEYEELALKGVDPSLGPTIRNMDIAGRGAEETDEKQKIPLLYAPSIHNAEASLAQLRDLVQTREPKHKKRFWIWMVIAPFTAPFMIVPIIPNLPFFYCVYRSWSHYRAYRASQYLNALIKHGHVVSAPSLELDAIYKQFGTKSITAEAAPPSSEDAKAQSSSQPATEDVEMLLTREAVPAIVSTFSLEETAASDMYRAIEQARVRTSKPIELAFASSSFGWYLCRSRVARRGQSLQKRYK